jgi:2-dehydro-3-deoxyphosphogluconate aldolase/(4S)-4-hydroxy-2-oxoglutarate aldolase
MLRYLNKYKLLEGTYLMTATNTIKNIFAYQRLLPIIQADDIQEGIAVTKAMDAAGLSVVEVVLRNEQALALASEIKSSFPHLVLGVGTVYNTDLLDKALLAGADFIVTPAVSPNLTKALVECGKPILPGVGGLSDIVTLLEHGVTEMKLFPAEIVGGVPLLKAVSSLFQEASFCPTGGITSVNQTTYLSQTNVFAVGGTWMVPKEAVKNRRWELITQACKEAVLAC